MSPRDPAPTRHAILDAASHLLEQGGLEVVTLRAVGERAGVSRAAPYRHFSDKSALLQALAAETLRRMALEVRLAARDKGAQAALRAGCLAYVSFAITHPNHYLLIFGDTPSISPSREAELAADDAMLSLRQLIDAAYDEIKVKTLETEPSGIPDAPARERATMLWISLHGIAQLCITGHLREPRTLNGDTHYDELVNLAVTAMLSMQAAD